MPIGFCASSEQDKRKSLLGFVEFPCLFSDGIFVLEDFRNCGVAKELKRDALVFAKDLGYKSIYTLVEHGNRYSLDLQRSFGAKIRRDPDCADTYWQCVYVL